MTEMVGEPDSPPAGEGPSLLEWATGLAEDPVLRARLAGEPHAVLDEQGLTTISPADLHHVLPLVTESVAARLGIEVDASAMACAAVHHGGEDAVGALARQLGAVTETVDLARAEEAPEVPSGPTTWVDLDPEPATATALATAAPPVTTEAHDAVSAVDATTPEPFEPDRMPDTGTTEQYDDATHRADDADTEF